VFNVICKGDILYSDDHTFLKQLSWTIYEEPQRHISSRKFANSTITVVHILLRTIK